MSWKLNRVEHVEVTLDNSGVYVVISRSISTDSLVNCGYMSTEARVDIMSSDGEPLQGFVGNGNDVRKAVIKWIWDRPLKQTNCISSEHASYIGYEIARAMADTDYVQD